MIFTPHILVGAAMGASFGPLGALAALVSHFFLDALPHYDYNISALQEKGLSRKFLLPFSKISVDLFFGLTLAGAILRAHANIEIAALGVFAALLPDGLLFLYWRFKKNSILRHLNFFHLHYHWPREKKSGLLGLAVETMVIAMALIALTLV
jgi:hypothetical protein